jgi:transcriptional regulator with XRE-family HTH domain
MEHFADYAEIGKNIRIARRAKGWTQAQLAEAVTCSTANITNIENANTKLSLNMLIRLVQVLEVSADQIIGIPTLSDTSGLATTEKQLREIWSSLSFGDAQICQQACVDFCKLFSQHFPAH